MTTDERQEVTVMLLRQVVCKEALELAIEEVREAAESKGHKLTPAELERTYIEPVLRMEGDFMSKARSEFEQSIAPIAIKQAIDDATIGVMQGRVRNWGGYLVKASRGNFVALGGELT